MKATFKIVVVSVGAALLVALMVWAALRTFDQMREAAEARKRTFILLNNADELLSALKDAETGQRGYLLTSNEDFLEPYLAVRGGIDGQIEELRRLSPTDAARNHVDALAPLIKAKLAGISRVIELHRSGETAAAVVIVDNGQGKRVMDSIRAEMRSLTELEERALAEHEADFQSNMRNLFIIIVATSLLMLLFALTFAYLVYMGTKQQLANLVHLETQNRLNIQQQNNQQLEQANTTLQISEQKLAVTLYSIGDAVMVTDSEGLVKILNPLAEQLTGWTQAEALGLPVDDVFHIVNQETRKPSTVPVNETLAKGTIQGLANHTVLISRDGSECPIADSCAPIRDINDKVIGAILVFRDVSKEYAAQQSLRDSSALIKAILNTVADGIITLRANGHIIETVNPAAEQMFGYAADKLVGQRFVMLMPEIDQEHITQSIEDYDTLTATTGARPVREVTGRRSDGSCFPMEITVSEMWLDGERHFTGILRDITARKLVEDELVNARTTAEKANLAKSEFLSSMSHELRSPLNAILGFGQLMETESPPPTTEQKESIAQILKAGWHLLALINEVLDLARIESRQVPLSEEPISVREVLLECESMIKPQAHNRGIEMTFPLFDTPFYVMADRTRVKQVMINLLSNAIKYNIDNGTIEVKCAESTPGRIRVSVRDTGAGLYPEQVAQLFKAFNRLGQETGVEEGTGIGLVVAKRLVELMGGKVGVESTIGVGSVFWFELRRVAAPECPAEAVQTEPSMSQLLAGGTRQYTLLYVEDNPANLKLVEHIIARHSDIRMLTAMDGNTGVDVARASSPDVILMDINLPGIDGFEALKILYSDPATAHIPVIALSANAMPRDVKRGLDAGFISYITKPIKIDELMEAIDLSLKHSKRPASQDV